MKFLLSLCGLCSSLLAMPAMSANSAVVQPWPKGTAFPLEVYEVDARDVPRLAARGWNIFQTYANRSTNQSDSYLATLSGHHVTGLMAIPCAGAKTSKIEWPAAKAQPWIGSLAGNLSLAWWDLPEEARPWSVPELKLLQDYTAWTRAGDPDRRPTYEYTPNNRNAAQISRITPFVDIVGLSCYCEEMGMPHAWVRYKIEEAGIHGFTLAGATVGRDYLHGQKIPVAIIYCAKFAKTGRRPAPDQTYHDVWSAIVSGAQGIGVYAYHHAMNDDATLAGNFARLNEAAKEISGPEKIGEVILQGEPNPGVGFNILSGPANTVSFRPPTEKSTFQYPSLHLLSKIKDGTIYVLAVNSTDQTVVTRITGLPQAAGAARLPFENRAVPVTAGNFTDTFAAWGVHIYKIQI